MVSWRLGKAVRLNEALVIKWETQRMVSGPAWMQEEVESGHRIHPSRGHGSWVLLEAREEDWQSYCRCDWDSMDRTDQCSHRAWELGCYCHRSSVKQNASVNPWHLILLLPFWVKKYILLKAQLATLEVLEWSYYPINPTANGSGIVCNDLLCHCPDHLPIIVHLWWMSAPGRGPFLILMIICDLQEFWLLLTGDLFGCYWLCPALSLDE